MKTLPSLKSTGKMIAETANQAQAETAKNLKRILKAEVMRSNRRWDTFHRIADTLQHALIFLIASSHIFIGLNGLAVMSEFGGIPFYYTTATPDCTFEKNLKVGLELALGVVLVWALFMEYRSKLASICIFWALAAVLLMALNYGIPICQNLQLNLGYIFMVWLQYTIQLGLVLWLWFSAIEDEDDDDDDELDDDPSKC